MRGIDDLNRGGSWEKTEGVVFMATIWGYGIGCLALRMGGVEGGGAEEAGSISHRANSRFMGGNVRYLIKICQD